jgi:AcrR family transcriptional regulator
MRAHLVEAAYRTLAERGYEATSIKDVARAAGVAPGLVHYYFASKAELLLAVVGEAAARAAQQRAALGQAAAGEQLAAAAVHQISGRLAREPEAYRLRFDLFALGLRHPDIGAALAELLADGRASIAGNLPRLATAAAGPVVEREALAAVFQAAFDGLGLQKLIDPAFAYERALSTLFTLVREVRLEA